jgi:hypothetical protein
MGRKSHNKTYEQMLEEKRIRAIEYYYNNRDAVNKKRRAAYEKLKKKTI